MTMFLGMQNLRVLLTYHLRQKSKNMPNDDAQKHVHFSNVTVREYEIRPSDTPAVSSGAGIEVRLSFDCVFASMYHLLKCLIPTLLFCS